MKYVIQHESSDDQQTREDLDKKMVGSVLLQKCGSKLLISASGLLEQSSSDPSIVLSSL